MNPIIRVENLGKLYQLGAHQHGAYKTLRETITAAFAAPWKSVRGNTVSNGHVRIEQDEAGAPSSIWALQDVSFEVRPGEVVGIIGRNGAGKSTLLKLLSRITEPTRGRIELRGRVGSLLEVGTGFHPELTGRENIYLNGAILGMSREEIDRKFDEIVAFSEVEDFLNTPVKRYSSGMYVRLAFAVAAHLDPETLVVDEVLAVGDAGFQKKCLGKMGDVARHGRTILLVSHNMGAIRGLCTRCLWIDAGRLVDDGAPERVVARYIESVFAKGFGEVRSKTNPASPLHITGILLKDDQGNSTIEFRPGDSLTVEIHYAAARRIEQPHFWIGFESQYGPMFAANMLIDGHCPAYIEGEGVLSCRIEHLPLLPQTFTVTLGVRGKDCVTELIAGVEAGFFHVGGKMLEHGFHGHFAERVAAKASPMILPYVWNLPGGRTEKVLGFQARGEAP